MGKQPENEMLLTTAGRVPTSCHGSYFCLGNSAEIIVIFVRETRELMAVVRGEGV